jgi:hypothetical protein
VRAYCGDQSPIAADRSLHDCVAFGDAGDVAIGNLVVDTNDVGLRSRDEEVEPRAGPGHRRPAQPTGLPKDHAGSYLDNGRRGRLVIDFECQVSAVVAEGDQRGGGRDVPSRDLARARHLP